MGGNLLFFPQQDFSDRHESFFNDNSATLTGTNDYSAQMHSLKIGKEIIVVLTFSKI